MTVTEYETCPVCDGSKTRTITKFDGYRSTTMKIPCTACEGKGKIPFIDLTKQKQEEENVKEVLNVTGLSDGWRSNSGWSNIHYFKDGKFLCGSIRSPITISSSTLVDDISSEIICKTCAQKLG
jgi:6-phosphogluconolactonase (cycloisomerase 2 family)